MNKIDAIQRIRSQLKRGACSVGSWMQIPNSSIAEIMGRANYDWVAVDLEHGSISLHQLPDIFRALELGHTLPLVRLAQGTSKDCKQALDAGAAGIIIPMIESAQQLRTVKLECSWPPSGIRGVGFSRANLFGKTFDAYVVEAQNPLLIAMIENVNAMSQLNDILRVEGLDALLIGPYDLSASMNLTAQLNHPDVIHVMETIRIQASQAGVACGIHQVSPSSLELQNKIEKGYQFIAYATDAIFLNQGAERPILINK